MSTTTATGAKRYMKAKTWGKANLVREDYPNRHEYRKAAAIGFDAYKQQQEAEKAARKTAAKPQPEPKQPDLSRLTKAQLLEIIAKMQMPRPEPAEERRPKAEPKPRKAAAKKTEEPEGDGKVYFDQYSEKSVIVFGDTKPVKDTIKELGGRWNRFVETPCGHGAWFVSLSTWSKNKKAAKSINAIQYC